ncbi:MAG: FxsA family protein [Pseudomonadota bacterium]
MPLFLLFLAVPLIEIGLFIQIGGWIGLWPTLAIVVATAVAGTYLVRSQGGAALRQLQGSMNELRDPTEPLAHGAMILFSGALLLTPGFFTDLIGFLLLIPGVRLWVMRYIRSRMVTAEFRYGSTTSAAQQPGVIDGEFEEVDPPEVYDGKPQRGSSGWTQH